MMSVRRFVSENRRKVWFSLGLNILVMISVLLMMMPIYESNDDVGILQLVNGSREVRDPHLVYQNIVLGACYKLLYGLTIRLPWYGIVQYLVVLVSLTAVTYVFFNRLNQGLALLTVLILQVFFAFECYIRIQYTKTAGIAAASGVFLLFYALSKHDTAWRENVIGIALGCTGFMYRNVEAAACIVLMSAIGLHFIISLREEDAVKRSKWKRCLCIFSILFGCIAFLYIIDEKAYEINPMWKSYKEFNELRTELLDYGFPDYGANIEEYYRLGINEDALQLYTTWNFNDPDKFNVPVMKQLVELKPQKHFTKATIQSFLSIMPDIMRYTYTFQCVFSFMILWLLWGRRRGKEIVCLIFEFGLFFALYLYLFYSGRYGVNLVDTGLWFSVSLVIGYFLGTGGTIRKRKIPVILSVVLCFFVASVGYKSWNPYMRSNHQGDQEQRRALRAVLETLGMDKEHLYIIKCGCISEYSCYGIFDTMPGEILNNMCWLSGWDCNTSGQLKTLENFGVKNPYKDLINRQDVILVDNNIELTVRYIQEYYDINAEAEFIKTVGNVDLYHIVS